MAVTVENRAYIGKGKILIRKRGAIATPFRYIGATSKLDLAIATEKKELPNLETVGGGNLITLERVKSLTGSTEGYNFSAENLSLALRAGLSDDAAGAAITGEKHIALAGSLVPFAHLPDLAGEMTAVIDVTAARANTTAYAKGATILASSVIYQATTAALQRHRRRHHHRRDGGLDQPGRGGNGGRHGLRQKRGRSVDRFRALRSRPTGVGRLHPERRALCRTAHLVGRRVRAVFRGAQRTQKRRGGSG